MKLAGRFEEQPEPEWESICTNKTSKEINAGTYKGSNSIQCRYINNSLRFYFALRHMTRGTNLNFSALISKGNPYHSDRVDSKSFYDTYLELTQEETFAIAHKPWDMIRQCKFAGFAIHPPCKELMEGVHQFFTPDFGVCFGYNVHNRSNETSFSYSIIGGRAFGLQLIIDIEGMQYLNHQKRCLGEI